MSHDIAAANSWTLPPTAAAEPTSPTGCRPDAQAAPLPVRLVDGRAVDIADWPISRLRQLQWEQEVAFAAAIRATAKGSAKRRRTIAQAYDTVCAILNQIRRQETDHGPFAMGMDRRYTRLVLQLLRQQSRNDDRANDNPPDARTQPAQDRGALFELGFGTGILLSAAARDGFTVGGLEVASQLYETCRQQLPKSQQQNLVCGDFLDVDLTPHRNRYDIVYWNDVFEHIPTDDIDDYLRGFYRLLRPGGQLVTVTPNWHMRPMDVTADHRPPRSEAIGFHLREYTLRDVAGKLRAAGFASIVTPWFVGKGSILMPPTGLAFTGLKMHLEPLIEYLPYPIAVQVCRRFGLCCTIATKPASH